jgi:uncharacterized OB-fold protein
VAGPARPLPQPTTRTAPFWEAAKRHELALQRCSDCGAWRHYPQPMCPACRSLAHTWERASGRGVIYSYSVAHRAFHPWWQERVPYAIATVELEEGVRMLCDLPGVPLAEVAIGRRVEVCFEDVDERITLPRFRLV